MAPEATPAGERPPVVGSPPLPITVAVASVPDPVDIASITTLLIAAAVAGAALLVARRTD